MWDLPSTADLPHALFDSGITAYIGAVLFVLGSTAFKFLVPALAGYIAYAIADRPGIAPGFVMGAIAVDLGGFGLPQSGSSAASSAVSSPVIALCGVPLEGGVLGPRPDAGAAHPAGRDPDRRLA